MPTAVTPSVSYPEDVRESLVGAEDVGWWFRARNRVITSVPGGAPVGGLAARRSAVHHRDHRRRAVLRSGRVWPTGGGSGSWPGSSRRSSRRTSSTVSWPSTMSLPATTPTSLPGGSGPAVPSPWPTRRPRPSAAATRPSLPPATSGTSPAPAWPFSTRGNHSRPRRADGCRRTACSMRTKPDFTPPRATTT